jgi:ATP-dependent helicase/nuclease subunit A
MKPRRIVPEETIDKQLGASDPRVSAFVSANAGSGKTTVLTRRVIRLLLAGVAPAAILCLTFTKAAAANMQNRIFRALGEWAAQDDAGLGEAIHEICGEAADAPTLVRARRLFAAAVETPGGLKVLTIHAFCERVLHLFPFEANVPAEFSVLEDRGASELLERARQAILVEANAEPDAPLGRALARIVEEAGEKAFGELLEEVTGERESVRAVLRDCGPVAATGKVRRLLGLESGETVASIEWMIDRFGLPESAWQGIETALRQAGQAKMATLADGFAAALRAGKDQRSARYRRIFTTDQDEARAPDGFLTKTLRSSHPALAAALEEERARIAHLLDRRRLAACAERTGALLIVAEALLSRYANAKRVRAALDFEDLIDRTLSLLLRAGADWVLYKLDRGIDHILVDEAQDTSPKQWQIIELLAREFTAGAGARGSLVRTIFAVGDEKQSIFSFQGAAPAEFARMRGHFRTALGEAHQRFVSIELKHSFRSTRDIIAAVDAVFADAANRRGLSSDDVATLHETVRGEEPGSVEVWPLIKPDAAAEIEAWDAPFDTTPNSSPATRAARRIASAVRRLIHEGDPQTGARYGPGDVMVLVRSRNALFDALIRALKREGVPVAGADRIVLMDHIAVMDLVALARFTLLPADDLTLATVLKTPLIGLDDDHLIRLAPGRGGSLWQALRGASLADAAFRAAHQRLSVWIDEAAFKTPFAFFADVLARDGGRRAFLARLGPEATDALDEFLGAASEFERAATPSLEGFLSWLAAAKAEIKRDMDVARDEVRVMTVHGAKGLEARVVVLADCCGAPNGRHDPKLFLVPDPGGGTGSKLLLWSPRCASDPPPAQAARRLIREEADGEHRRLLYVAMTRAEERLIVSGHEGARARADGNWYDMVERALRRAGARQEAMPAGEGERLVFETTPRTRILRAGEERRAEPGALPDWLSRPPRPEAPAAIPLTPSDALEASDAASGRAARTADEGGGAAARGRLIHRLLQSLPDIVPGERRNAARRFLAQAAPALASQHRQLTDEVMAIVEDATFGPLFAPGSRAEVPLIGRLSRPGHPDRLVSGRLDRLWVGPHEVLIADFKTNRSPPLSVSDVSADYIAQLALYRALIARLYPHCAVRAGLVWTSVARLMQVPATAMDDAFARLLPGAL